jgi:hypothetical protein
VSPVDYHAWTHRPKALGGTDPVDSLRWPWLVLVNSGQTLPGDNAARESLLTEAYWDTSLTSDPFDISSVDDGEGNDYWQLHLLYEGWYDIEVVHQLEEVGSDGGANVYFSQEVVIVSGTSFDADTPLGRAAAWTAAGPELVITPYISDFRRVWVNSGSRLVDTFVKQNSGADKSINGHLKVFYLGGLGGAIDNTTWQFADATA